MSLPTAPTVHADPRLPLASFPLDAGGVRKVECLSAPLATEGVRVCVFRPLLEDQRRARPSGALSLVPASAPAELAEGAAAAAFEHDGSTVRCQIRFGEGHSIYGGGSDAERLLRRDEAVELWNRRGVGPVLPIAIALDPDGAAHAVVADTFQPGLVQFASDGVEFAILNEPFDLWRLDASEPRALLAALRELLGELALPPLWSLGYQHVLRGADSGAAALEFAARLRSRHIPCDALWLDGALLDRGRTFAWDKQRVPDPTALVEALHERELRVVCAAEPAIAIGKHYPPHKTGIDGEHFIVDAAGTPLRGRTRSGVTLFPDFTREETRAWWAGHVERFAEAGIDGLWSERDGPFLERTPRHALPFTARHRGLGEGPHERFHNRVGALGAGASRDGLAQAHPTQRPFVAADSAHFASAACAATLLEADDGSWEGLRRALPRALSLGLCGLPFSGFEIGGGAGPSGELLARWYELACLLPVVRGSSVASGDKRAPWAHGAEVERAIKAAVERRMRLVPTLYSLLAQCRRSGLPLARPMFLADPTDRALRGIDDQFLLGEDLVVAPVLQPGAKERTVLLPSSPTGGWYLLEGGKDVLPAGRYTVEAPLGRTPIFVRAGRILVTRAPARSTAVQLEQDPELLVFFDSRQRASGSFHEDEGDGPAPATGTTELSARVQRGRVVIDAFAEGREVVDRAWHVQSHGLGPARP